MWMQRHAAAARTTTQQQEWMLELRTRGTSESRVSAATSRCQHGARRAIAQGRLNPPRTTAAPFLGRAEERGRQASSLRSPATPGIATASRVHSSATLTFAAVRSADRPSFYSAGRASAASCSSGEHILASASILHDSATTVDLPQLVGSLCGKRATCLLIVAPVATSAVWSSRVGTICRSACALDDAPSRWLTDLNSRLASSSRMLSSSWVTGMSG